MKIWKKTSHKALALLMAAAMLLSVLPAPAFADGATTVIDATAKSAAELQSALDTALSAGAKTIEIKLPATPADQVYPVIENAFNAHQSGAPYELSLSGVTAIKNYALDITVPHSLALPDALSIGVMSFSMSGITAISAPKVTTLGSSAFTACHQLSSVDMPALTTMADQAFKECSALTEISFPALTSADVHALAFCSNLRKVYLPSLTTGGIYVFAYSPLTELTLGSVSTMGADAFSNIDTAKLDLTLGCNTAGYNAAEPNKFLGLTFRSVTPTHFINPDSHTCAYCLQSAHPVCGASHRDIGNHSSCSDVSWTGIYNQTELEAMMSGGHYYLAADIALSDTVVISGDIDLCLNGHKLTGSAGATLSLADYSDVTICDCQVAGVIENTGSGHAVYVDMESNVTFNLYGGTLKSASGSAYCDYDGSSNIFNQYGGTVTSGGNYCVHLYYGTGIYNLYGGAVDSTGYWGIVTTGSEAQISMSGNASVNKPVWVTNPITILSPLETPTAPITVRFTLDSGSNREGTITNGWNTHMASAEISQYFTPYDSSNFAIAKGDTGELMMVRNRVAPTAAHFLFTPPSDLVYSNLPKTASVEPAPSAMGMGAVTVKYYDENGNLLPGAPTAVGTYTLKIDVTQGSGFLAATDLSDPAWTFTIARTATPTPAYTVSSYAYNKGSTYYVRGDSYVFLVAPDALGIGTDPAGPFMNQLLLDANTPVPDQVWLCDLQGHLTDAIAVTETFVFDSSAPTLDGIEDGKTYYGDLTVIKNGEQFYDIDYVTLDGEHMGFAEGTYGRIPADNQEHTVIAYDRVGNYTSYTVKVMKKFSVTVPANQVGYKLETDVTSAVPGEDVYISLAVQEGYEKTAGFAVKVNGEKIELTEYGNVIVTATGDMEITVEGIRKIPGKITFDFAGGNIGGLTYNIEIELNEDGTLTDNAPTGLSKDGYTFAGWYTEDSKLVINPETATFTDGTKLIAHFTPIETSPGGSDPDGVIPEPEETVPEETEPEETEPEETEPEETAPEETKPEETEPEETEPEETEPEEFVPEETVPKGDAPPKTGDDSPLLFFCAAMVMSAVCLFALLLTRRKKENS